MATFSGTSGNDSFTGNAEFDSIIGNGGDDRLNGAAGDDTINGGNGNDTLYDGFSGSSDTASDMDSLYGGAGDDWLISTQGSHFQDIDQLFGGEGNDRIQLNGAQTDDMADGGAGIDHFVLSFSEYELRTVFATFNATGFEVQVAGINTVFASGFERMDISTGSGSDILIGGALGDGFYSTGGNDRIEGRAGDDSIAVNLYASGLALQAVTLEGGLGTDALTWSVQNTLAEDHVFDLGSGIFTRAGVSLGVITGFEQLFISAAGGNDSLVGAGLADFLSGGAGADRLLGGGGDDTLRGDGGGDEIYGGNGHDSITTEGYGGTASSNAAYGGTGDDTLIGGSLVDTLDGGAGDDIYLVGAGDILIDSAGVDAIQTDATTVDLRAYAMIEEVHFTGYDLIATGNDLDNWMGFVTPYGSNDGPLRLYGLGGNDTLEGGSRFDLLSGGSGKDRLVGGAHNDNILGGIGNDRAFGGADYDSVQGNGGNDTLFGGGGHDWVRGNDGDDVVHGDDAFDLTGFVPGTGVMTKAAGTGTSFQAALDISTGYALTANPDIAGSTDVPHLTINATMNTVTSFGDIYRIDGVKAGQTLTLDIDRGVLAGQLETEIRVYDAAFRELVNSDSFSSLSDGGTGSTSFYDAYLEFVADLGGTFYIAVWNASFSGTTSDQYALHVSLGAAGGADAVEGGEGNDEVHGGGADDTLTGGAGDDLLDGGSGVDWASYEGTRGGVQVSLAVTGAQQTLGAGMDTLIRVENLLGGADNDRLTGNGGANMLTGGRGRDQLSGGGGDDRLEGGTAADRLTGGGGADRFVFAEVVSAAGAVDTITDFAPGQDQIALARAPFAALGTSVGAAQLAIGAAAMTAEHRLIYQTGTGLLLYDADGLGGAAAMAFVQLDSGLALTEGSFVMI